MQYTNEIYIGDQEFKLDVDFQSFKIICKDKLQQKIFLLKVDKQNYKKLLPKLKNSTQYEQVCDTVEKIFNKEYKADFSCEKIECLESSITSILGEIHLRLMEVKSISDMIKNLEMDNQNNLTIMNKIDEIR